MREREKSLLISREEQHARSQLQDLEAILSKKFSLVKDQISLKFLDGVLLQL